MQPSRKTLLFLSVLLTCGLGEPARGGVLSETPVWTATGEVDQAHLGFSLATAGDVNADGFSDVIVGAYNADLGPARGVVYVYHGSPAGLSATPDWTREAVSASDFSFGAVVATAGDVNGDGYSDVLVGVSSADYGEMLMGAAYLFLGSASGLSQTHAWTVHGSMGFEYFGAALSTAGDVNADGFSDVLVGARGYENGESSEGAVSLYMGSAAGLGAEPAWRFESDHQGAGLGDSASTAGDVNGDGYCDIIVGAHWYTELSGKEGAAYVFYGGVDGPAPTPDWRVLGDNDSDMLGEAVSTAGDVNGDGYADVIIGLRGYANGQTAEGAVYAYHGSAAGLPPQPDWIVEGNLDNSAFGAKLGPAGDVNGDGYADIAVGAFFYENGEVNEGAGFVFLGSAAGLSGQPAWTDEPDQEQAWYGTAIGTAGDVNGDGFSDLLAGASMYDAGTGDEGAAYLYYGSGEVPSDVPAWTFEGGQEDAQLGHNVQTAGDVNGDGYADVIAGALGYGVDQAGIGRASLFFGSPAGPSASPDWEVESDQEASYFGWTVNTVGDLNGDGYSDVAVGAKLYDNPDSNEGEAYIYFGGPDGPSLTPDWWEVGDQLGGQYGDRIATAGDVNADGYSDLVISAVTYDNGNGDEGRVYLYHGGPGGPSLTPDWIAEGDSFGALFGHWINSAGDVNGDGYSDLAIGSRGYREVAMEGGRAVVYLGGPSGLSDTPHWEGLGSQAGEFYGDSIATAGDVNGDGYSDILVCVEGFSNPETNEGRVDLHLGGPAGLSASPDWTVEGNVAEAWLGDFVYTAGDVNADGFDDMIIGADKHTGDLFQEGKVYLFYGNKNPGVSLRPRQMTVGWDQLVQPLAATGSVDSVGIALWARTPAGRTRARLVWEVKPLGTPFDMSSIGMGGFKDIGLSGSDTGQLVAGLDQDTPYHWRARLQYFPHMNYGKWVSGGGPNAWGETDFRTSADCTPTGADEFACDGVDDDCDGLTDEEADIDCDDGLACTSDECVNGTCRNEHVSGCLIEDACLVDGADHPGDPCLACRPEISLQNWSPKEPGSVCGESSCDDGLYTPPPTCDASGTCVPGEEIECASGQCADQNECLDTNPAVGTLQVSLGRALDHGTRVFGDSPRVVLRMDFETDAVSGTLDSLTLLFPGLEEVPSHWRWVRVSLYADGDPDGEIGPEAEPLGTVWLREGQVDLSGLGLVLPAMTSTGVLVGMSVVIPTQTASVVLLFPLGLLLMGLLLSRRRGFRRIMLVVLVLLIAALYGCTRYGYYQTTFRTRAVLEQGSDVGVVTHPGDDLQVDGPPLAGDDFTLDVSR